MYSNRNSAMKTYNMIEQKTIMHRGKEHNTRTATENNQ